MKKANAGAAVMAALLLCVAVTGHVAANGRCPEGEKTMTEGKIAAVLERHKNELMALPGVTGVAEGRCDGSPCIKVYVIMKKPETAGKIPAEIEGFPVSVEETGEFKRLPEKGG